MSPGHDSVRAALFATPVGWATVDHAGIVGAEMRPWVHKKIAEFLGEPEEEALMTFVLELSVAEPVLEELELALEDDAMTQWCSVRRAVSSWKET